MTHARADIAATVRRKYLCGVLGHEWGKDDHCIHCGKERRQ